MSDRGPGIPAEALEAIFEPHVRLAPGGAAGGAGGAGGAGAGEGPKGAGLGLYIARGIVEGHGGRLWAESAGPGQGSTFTMALPLAQAPRRAARRGRR